MAYEKQFWEYEPSGNDDEINRIEVDRINLRNKVEKQAERIKQLEAENDLLRLQISDDREYYRGLIEQEHRDATHEIDKYRNP